MLPPAPHEALPIERPLFRGYALVAACVAWIVGIAIGELRPLAPISPLAWAGSACVFAATGISLQWIRFRWVLRRYPAFRRSMAALVALLALAFWIALGAGRAAWAGMSNGAQPVSALPPGVPVQVRGDVVAEPITETGGRLLTIAANSVSRDQGSTWQPAAGRVEVFLAGPDDWFAPAYGDTLRLAGKLEGLSTGSAPGVMARLTGAHAQILSRGGGNPLFAWLFDLRIRLAQAIQQTLPEPEAALMIGILLGLKTPVLRARLSLFTSTGTIHLVVPAGLKVSLLADIARRVSAPFGLWLSTCASLVVIVAYAAVGGGGPAAVRAAIMGALLVVAPALGRRYDVFAALAFAVLLMTLLDPLLIYDAGFQLTVLATLGIPSLAPTLQRWLMRPLAHVRWANVLAPLVELMSVTIAAQFATIPVVAMTFGLVSLVAPLANLLVVPLLSPLLVLGVALAMAALVAPTLALVIAFAAWPLLWLTDRAIELAAALPSAALPAVGTSVWAAWAYYVALAGAIGAVAWYTRRRAATSASIDGSPLVGTSLVGRAATRRAAFRVITAGALLFVLLGTVGAAGPVMANGHGQIDFLDVGAGGEATLMRLADGTTVLIDGGPSGPGLESALSARLPFWQRSLDLAVLTDARAGEVSGLADATTHFSIALAVDAGMLHPTAEYLAWLDALGRANTPRTTVRRGDIIHLGDSVMLRILAPPRSLYPPGYGTTSRSNDLIARLDAPGLRVLLLGSADDYALDALALSGEPLAADVVEVALPPTGGVDLEGPLGDVLLAAHPRLVVVTQAPPVARPHARPTQTSSDFIWPPDAPTAQSLGALIVRTSRVGTVTLSQRSDGGWSLEGT